MAKFFFKDTSSGVITEVNATVPFDAAAYLGVGTYQVVAASAFAGTDVVISAPPPAGFAPSDLFTVGVKGAWYDPSDLSTLFQDTAGATPVAAAGQTVARVNDKSGNGNHLLQAIAGARPTYQVDGNGKGYLAFNGTSNYLSVASRFGLVADPAMTVAVGLVPLNVGAAGKRTWHLGGTGSGIIGGEFGPAGWSWRHNGGGYRIFGPTAFGTAKTAIWSRGAASTYGAGSLYLDNTAQAQTAVGNGTAHPTDTTANFNIGQSGLSGTELWASMSLYGLILIDRAASAQERGDITAWMDGKTGI